MNSGTPFDEQRPEQPVEPPSEDSPSDVNSAAPIVPEVIMPEVIWAEVVDEKSFRSVQPERRRRVLLPALLFVATCLSTLLAGTEGVFALGEGVSGILMGLVEALTRGLQYAVPVMTILIFHEAGHFFQARRYGVYSSYPFFIPMPISPLGTLGAVIAMEPRMGNRKALFDIGISGPLAGLVPTLFFCILGLYYSRVVPMPDLPAGARAGLLGEPLLFQALTKWILGAGPDDLVLAHPMAFAGWVGLLITALNLMPIGQLDGGHVLYALLRKKAHTVASALLLAAIAAVLYFELYGWTLMLFLLLLMGPIHPPTANDNMPLGSGRIVLGWLTLAFIFVGFTPTPFAG